MLGGYVKRIREQGSERLEQFLRTPTGMAPNLAGELGTPLGVWGMILERLETVQLRPGHPPCTTTLSNILMARPHL